MLIPSVCSVLVCVLYPSSNDFQKKSSHSSSSFFMKNKEGSDLKFTARGSNIQITFPELPSIPSLPSLPAIPSVTVEPSIPSLPSLPTLPTTPSVPSIASLPSLPTLPTFPPLVPLQASSLFSLSNLESSSFAEDFLNQLSRMNPIINATMSFPNNRKRHITYGTIVKIEPSGKIWVQRGYTIFPVKIYGEGNESKFPPFLEYLVQRIQAFFSVYRYEDTSRPVLLPHEIAEKIEEPSKVEVLLDLEGQEQEDTHNNDDYDQLEYNHDYEEYDIDNNNDDEMYSEPIAVAESISSNIGPEEEDAHDGNIDGEFTTGDNNFDYHLIEETTSPDEDYTTTRLQDDTGDDYDDSFAVQKDEEYFSTKKINKTKLNKDLINGRKFVMLY